MTTPIAQHVHLGDTDLPDGLRALFRLLQTDMSLLPGVLRLVEQLSGHRPPALPRAEGTRWIPTRPRGVTWSWLGRGFAAAAIMTLPIGLANAVAGEGTPMWRQAGAIPAWPTARDTFRQLAQGVAQKIEGASVEEVREDNELVIYLLADNYRAWAATDRAGRIVSWGAIDARQAPAKHLRGDGAPARIEDILASNV